MPPLHPRGRRGPGPGKHRLARRGLPRQSASSPAVSQATTLTLICMAPPANRLATLDTDRGVTPSSRRKSWHIVSGIGDPGSIFTVYTSGNDSRNEGMRPANGSHLDACSSDQRAGVRPRPGGTGPTDRDPTDPIPNHRFRRIKNRSDEPSRVDPCNSGDPRQKPTGPGSVGADPTSKPRIPRISRINGPDRPSRLPSV